MTRRNRRQFLEDSMLATAAAVAAGSPDALLAEPAPQSPSPNERLGVAVVGVRGRGNSHLAAVAARRDAHLLYICDVDSEVGGRRVGQVAKRQRRAPRLVEDVRQVLDDPHVDIVSIATPDHWHALMAIWAMQAGKDVYLEKPVGHNVTEGRRIVQAARRYGRMCQTGMQWRSNPGAKRAAEYLRSGALGNVRSGRGVCCRRRQRIGLRGLYPLPLGVQYDLWLGPAPRQPLTRPSLHHDWHWQWPYGGGDACHQGVCQLDLARWGLALDQLPATVLSCGTRFPTNDVADTAHSQVVIHDYGSKSILFEVRGRASPPVAKDMVVFEADEGCLIMTGYHSGVAFDHTGKMLESFHGQGDHWDNFIRAVRKRDTAELHADIEAGHLSSALCHLGNISYRLGERIAPDQFEAGLDSIFSDGNLPAQFRSTCRELQDAVVTHDQSICLGRVLRLDPSKERFVDDRLNPLLTREYRSPFVVPSAGQV